MKRSSSQGGQPAAKRPKRATVAELLRTHDFPTLSSLVLGGGNLQQSTDIPSHSDSEEIFAASSGADDRWTIVMAILFCQNWRSPPVSSAMLAVLDEAKEHPLFVTVAAKLNLLSNPQLVCILASITGDNQKVLEESPFFIPTSQVRQLLAAGGLHFFPKTFQQLELILNVGQDAIPLIRENTDLFLQHKTWCIQHWCLLIVAGLVEKDEAFSHIKTAGRLYFYNEGCDSAAFVQVMQPLVPELSSLLPASPSTSCLIDSMMTKYLGRNSATTLEIIWWNDNVHEVKALKTTTNPDVINLLLTKATSSQQVLDLLTRVQVWVGSSLTLPASAKQLLQGKNDEIWEAFKAAYQRRSPAFLTLLGSGVYTIRDAGLRVFCHIASSLMQGSHPVFRLPIQNKNAVIQMMHMLKRMVETSFWAQKLMVNLRKSFSLLRAQFTDGTRISLPVYFASYHTIISRPLNPEHVPLVQLYTALGNIFLSPTTSVDPVVEVLSRITEEDKLWCHAILLNFFTEMLHKSRVEKIKAIYAALPAEWQEFVVNGIAPLSIADLNQDRRHLLFLIQQKESDVEKQRIQQEWEAKKATVPQETWPQEKKRFCQEQVVKRRIIECTQCKAIVPCKFAKFTCCYDGRQQFFCSECGVAKKKCVQCKIQHSTFCIVLPE